MIRLPSLNITRFGAKLPNPIQRLSSIISTTRSYVTIPFQEKLSKFVRTNDIESIETELETIKYLPKTKPLRVFLVSHAGEKPLDLLATYPQIAHVDSVHTDMPSYHLGQLRRHLSMSLPVTEQLNFLGLGDVNYNYASSPSRLRTYETLKKNLEPETQSFFDELQNEIQSGIAHEGGWERGFHSVQMALQEKDINLKSLFHLPHKLLNILNDSLNGEILSAVVPLGLEEDEWDDKLKMLFLVMNSKLIRAVENGLENNYVAHFAFHNSFPNLEKGLPHYLRNQNQDDLIKRLPLLHIHHDENPFKKLLELSQTSGPYDLISLSDSLDLDRDSKIENHLRNHVIPSLNQNGGVLCRNSTVKATGEIMERCRLRVDYKINSRLEDVETSYLISHVVFGRK